MGSLLLLGSTAAAQIVTENAGVVSPETPILRESLAYLGTENLEELRLLNQLSWSPDGRHELRFSIPVVSRKVETESAGGGELDQRLEGLGDASLRFKRSLWQVDDVMESTRWALLAELTAPTGEDDERVEGTLLPRRLRVGTGDWTLGAGTAFTRIVDRHRASLELFLRHRTGHEGVQLGDSADLNLAWWYRLQPAAFQADDETTEVRGVLELLSSYRLPSEVDGRDTDDDGWLVWLAPGVQLYPGKEVLVEANVQFPIRQDLEDDLGDRDWAAVLVIKFLF